jgi:hypothetical protein
MSHHPKTSSLIVWLKAPRRTIYNNKIRNIYQAACTEIILSVSFPKMMTSIPDKFLIHCYRQGSSLVKRPFRCQLLGKLMIYQKVFTSFIETSLIFGKISQKVEVSYLDMYTTMTSRWYSTLTSIVCLMMKPITTKNSSIIWLLEKKNKHLIGLLKWRLKSKMIFFRIKRGIQLKSLLQLRLLGRSLGKIRSLRRRM